MTTVVFRVAKMAETLRLITFVKTVYSASVMFVSDIMTKFLRDMTY